MPHCQENNRKKNLRIGITVLLFIFLLSYTVYSVKAGVNPPTTTHEFSGTLGSNDWYTSTVDVTLRVSDLESGPASTTYWLNSNVPTTVDYDSSQNQILNPSFENVIRHGWWWFYWYTIQHWDDNDCGLGCWVLFWPSELYAKYGSQSAATGILGSGKYWYTNKARNITVSSGETYTISAWVKTLDIWGDPGAWIEVWVNHNAAEDGIKIAESAKITGTQGWTILSTTFTIPATYNKVYIRLVTEDTGFIGASWWDGVTMFGGTDFNTSFTVVDNGLHNLYYYSTDNNDNVESVTTTTLKIDTVGPENWDNFDFEQDLINTSQYKGEIEVQDVTSGVQVATGEYAYYTENNSEYWDHNGDLNTDWYEVDSIEIVPTGVPASDGEINLVKVITPFIDFGAVPGPKRIQFRLMDMAGNLSSSTVMTIGGPWIQQFGMSDIYVNGDIVMSNEPLVEGAINAESLVSISGVDITNFSTTHDVSYAGYSYVTTETLSDVLSDYNLIKNKAVPLPDNNLPSSSGVYIFDGDYVVDFNTITTEFENNVHSSIVIITGDLSIHEDYNINNESSVVFLVEDDIFINGEVYDIDGVFIATGTINTNYDSQFNRQLTVDGSLIALDGFNLGRDLGKVGDPSNLTDPSEVINFMARYYFSSTLTENMGGSQVKMTWQEE